MVSLAFSHVSDTPHTDDTFLVGTAQCCQSLHQSQDLKSQGIFGSLLGAAIPLDNLMVGLQCNPLAQTLPILSGASTCQSQPVCCTGNKL